MFRVYEKRINYPKPVTLAETEAGRKETLTRGYVPPGRSGSLNTALRLGHNFEVTQLLRDHLGGSQQSGARKAERSEPKHCLWMFLAVVQESTRGMQVLEWSQSEVNVGDLRDRKEATLSLR